MDKNDSINDDVSKLQAYIEKRLIEGLLEKNKDPNDGNFLSIFDIFEYESYLRTLDKYLNE